MKPEDRAICVACDYSATGEGRSIFLLMTYAYPRREDYLKESWIDDEGKFHYESETKNTPQERALREFKERFGDYFSIGADVLEFEEFVKQYQAMIPEVAINVAREGAGNLNWYQSLHFNFS